MRVCILKIPIVPSPCVQIIYRVSCYPSSPRGGNLFDLIAFLEYSDSTINLFYIHEGCQWGIWVKKSVLNVCVEVLCSVQSCWGLLGVGIRCLAERCVKIKSSAVCLEFFDKLFDVDRSSCVVSHNANVVCILVSSWGSFKLIQILK